jgi:cytochrome c
MNKLKFLIVSAALTGFIFSVNAAFAGGGEEHVHGDKESIHGDEEAVHEDEVSVHEAGEHVHEFEEGASALKQCLACHSIVEGKNMHGPSLFGVIGRAPGTMDGFKYSPAMTAFGEAGNVWNAETLGAYLKNPGKALPGNRMAFPGIKDQDDLENLLDYLETLKAE